MLTGCMFSLFLRKLGAERALLWEHQIHPSGFIVPEGQSCHEWLTFKEEAVFCECCASLSKVLKTGAKCKLYKGLKGSMLLVTCVTASAGCCTGFRSRGLNLLLARECCWCWHLFTFIAYGGEEKSSVFIEVVECIRIQQKNYTKTDFNSFGVTVISPVIRNHFSGAVN